MCECVSWYYVVALICIVVFFQILMYKLGCMQGEKSAYKRFTKVCNECRNSCKKMQQFGKVEQLRKRESD